MHLQDIRKIDKNQVLTDEEVQSILMAVLKTRKDEGLGATKQELQIAVDWANDTKTMYILLELVLRKEVDIDVKDGDVRFRLSSITQMIKKIM